MGRDARTASGFFEPGDELLLVSGGDESWAYLVAYGGTTQPTVVRWYESDSLPLGEVSYSPAEWGALIETGQLGRV